MTCRPAVALAAALAALVCSSPALAGNWLPHPADATWTYAWTDSVYQQTPVNERVTVKSQKGSSFVLAWTTEDDDLANGDDTPASVGTVSFQDTNSGVVNTDWSSNAPPQGFPILCDKASQCGNSLASTYYDVIWGGRSPVLAEPLLKGVTWTSLGGAGNDITSTSHYLGQEQVTVPAFSTPVTAAKVRTEITQTGALGDPYGSGVRTVWWVWGVGPVKIVFEHAGGSKAPVTTSVLQSTSLAAQPAPPDDDFFPLVKGRTATYRWTNAKHLGQPEVEKVSTTSAANGSGQLSVTSVSGPIKVEGLYGFTFRLDGLTNIFGTTKSQSTAAFPPLGPKGSPPAKRRHFVTLFDLMDFGFNPIFAAYPQAGQTWAADPSGRDFDFYGVTGSTKVLGVQQVRVPAGTFSALAVQTTLKQPGFPFGSGTRTSWFAPGKGLVKLTFRHGDGSVSQVELLK